MKLKKDSSEQKLRGAYYTPFQLAVEMVKLFDMHNFNMILEPSCGDGVFLDAMRELDLIDKFSEITAIEIDEAESVKVDNFYADYGNVEVKNQDFFLFHKEYCDKKKYDFIVGNPPYIRYQYLTEEQREIFSNILTAQGMKSNKLINAWVGFLVACTQLLNDNGVVAFVIPAEILQVAYAEDLRLFLSNQYSKITLITFEKLVFPNIEQEVLIFIGEKGEEEKGIRIIELNDVEGFKSLILESNGYQKMLHVKEKWTKYFVNSDEIKLIQDIRSDNRFAQFSSFGKINVGVTTGNNDFFSVDESTCREYNLEAVTLPLIGRSAHAHGIFFTMEDWKANVEKNKKARLIVFPEIQLAEYPQKHKDYIVLGEEQGVHKGYKCSIRNEWYKVPSIWIPDAFFLRRNNLYPKFVLNSCDAISTDTMHRIKFNEGVDPETLLVSYYNSISFAFTEISGRSYGGGVLEILPGEVGNIMLPKVENLSEPVKNKMLKMIDDVVRDNLDIEIALDYIDEELLVRHMGIEEETCRMCRKIWRKLQKRRLGRGNV